MQRLRQLSMRHLRGPETPRQRAQLRLVAREDGLALALPLPLRPRVRRAQQVAARKVLARLRCRA
jgi:hypothetical protein